MIVDVIIPTYRPGEKFEKLIEKLENQTVPVHEIIVINTKVNREDVNSRLNRTVEVCDNIRLYQIPKEEFDHGRSRNYGASLSKADICIFMTQDAVPADEYLLENITAPFADSRVICSYARQIPDTDSREIEKLTRSFNYPDRDMVKTAGDVQTMGIKTIFCSNVCCAYRMELFNRLGGFISHTIFNEDMIFAGRAVQKGYAVAYASRAKVIHSHNYTGKQQLKRNFDLGVSQTEHPEIFKEFSSEKEGVRMVKKVISMLKQSGHGREIIPYIYQSGCKYIGYRLGRSYRKLPNFIIRKCTMNPGYFEERMKS